MSTLVPSAADLGYDPWDPAFVADPYPALARLREQAPGPLRRADEPVAGVPPRRRQRPAPRPAAGPLVPPRREPRGMGPDPAAGRTRRRSGTCSTSS